ncbi:unnamed protein product [Vitrella brassicaformis CCMP3155]|uniref:Glycosyl transferase 64 domain-containing protein n=1 Tax=Vitrella brassicaformis (strain CCMP3155) TaxID=1169540 RepID=A0A0G4FE98_VITBC|nr:unnamed protein product [Vitrella brassicaformis CCMP3155]|mmetsp:Transcript_25400/g.62909  ORF Transcript_25400/g.62909 Transcript_25400/m.62909 type:complete len:252 (-) Transcript_25400:240-995(-)|eukprot:CEM11531.1 unnamed protein product [Vitrella brassicaformis CCMP3155]
MGPSRAENWLAKHVRLLEKCLVAHEILIDWWSEKESPSEAAQAYFRNTSKVRLAPGKRGLGDRYFVTEHITTPFTVIVDDDKSFSCDLMHGLLLAAQRFPNKIITVKKNNRHVYLCKDTQLLWYYRPERYRIEPDGAIGLTSAALVPTSLMKAYRTMIPPSVIALINRELNCEDMLFNWLAARLNPDNESSVFLSYSGGGIFDGRMGGKALCKRKNSVQRRSACLNYIRAMFPYWPIPRVPSYHVVVEDKK